MPSLMVERVFPIRVHVRKGLEIASVAPSEPESIANAATSVLPILPRSIFDPTPFKFDQQDRTFTPEDEDPTSSVPPHQQEFISAKAPLVVLQKYAITAEQGTIGDHQERNSTEKRFITQRSHYTFGNPQDSSNKTSPSQTSYRCEDEPIHIPGAVQQLGALVVVKQDAHGSFLVRVASENSENIISHTPEALFNLHCFTDILPPKDKGEFILRVSLLTSQLQSPNPRTAPDVFPLSLNSPIRQPTLVWCALHLNNDGLVICEFEPQSDIFAPMYQPTNGLPAYPVQVINSSPSKEDILRSTTSKSHPINALRFARKQGKELGHMEMFRSLCEIQSQLADATTLQELLDVVVGLVSELTGFHRVMVYQFDESSCGSVVSELVNEMASKDLYRGLHFPASDIPVQARQMYMINRIRILYDRKKETARLVCRDIEDAECPLDLTHSYLRAMSPIHLKYLENMGVQASMSISLTLNNQLWGLISCHNYGERMHMSLLLRELCRGLGDCASSHIEKLIYASRIQARKPLSHPPPKKSPSAYIAASSVDLLRMFDAEFGLLIIKGEARTIGRLLAYHEAVGISKYIRARAPKTIMTSSNLTRDFPDLVYPPGFTQLAGILVIPLALNGTDFFILFRRGQLREVKWAGNPYEKEQQVTESYLQPRTSFKQWSETVIGTSREWTEDEVDSAAVLGTLYSRFIEIWRQRETVVQQNRMTRLLIRNAGHEVRTPLNSVINYLEMALEETLDEKARDSLERSLSASRSLVTVVNDLLDLTNAESDAYVVHEEDLELKPQVLQLIGAFREEATRKGIELAFEDDLSIPHRLRGDPPRLRQVMSNLLDNAIQYSDKGLITTGIHLLAQTDTTSMVEIYVHDSGPGLSEAELDNIFQDFEQILDDEEYEISPKGRDEGEGQESPTAKQVSVGLGLAIVARFVRLNHGQVSISSEEGKGTRVAVTLPFRKTLPDSPRDRRRSIKIPLPTPPTELQTLLTEPHGFTTPPTLGLFTTAQTAEGMNIDTISSQEQTKSPASDSGFQMSPTSGEPSVGTMNATRYPFPSMFSCLKILVAEDNPLNSRLLETRLKRKGHSVTLASDGQACADIFKSQPHLFDIILMDIQMPVIDGLESTRTIRSHENLVYPQASPLKPHPHAYGRVPIIAVSASLQESLRDEYIKLGFDGWILKPINLKRLELLLQAVWNQQVRSKLLDNNDDCAWADGGWFGEQRKSELTESELQQSGSSELGLEDPVLKEPESRRPELRKLDLKEPELIECELTKL